MEHMLEDSLQERATQIKLVILDVDGVLTDGSLFYDNQGQEYKAFNSKDGHGIRMLKDAGIEVAIITGRQSELVLHRAENLKISPALIYQGYRDKRPAFQALLKKTQLAAHNIAYVGDDVIDLPIMSKVGLAISVSDAHPFVRQHSHWVTHNAGGKGAVREVCERLLAEQGKLDAMLASYLK
jgi:3-deoxy-D-manno-octulosonate 8-phosphate phosphatase (KDO 8-P phosphatase)